jgi:tripartite-type tricarboxylate transporter receptor subunit TctC
VSDFTPVAIVGVSSGWTLSVHPSVPARTVKEFTAFARARPGEIVMGTLGAGSGPYLVAKTFERLAGLKLIEVSYKGSAEAMRDLLGGQIMMYSDGLAGALAQHKAGRLRILAITGPKRSPLVPEVATLVESGYPEMALTNFWALLAPAGTPPEVVARLHAAVVKATDQETFRTRLASEGVVPGTSTPAELADAIRHDTEKWRRLIASLNLKPE